MQRGVAAPPFYGAQPKPSPFRADKGEYLTSLGSPIKSRIDPYEYAIAAAPGHTASLPRRSFYQGLKRWPTTRQQPELSPNRSTGWPDPNMGRAIVKDREV